MPEIKRADGGFENISDEDIEAAAAHYDRLMKRTSLIIDLDSNCGICKDFIEQLKEKGTVNTDIDGTHIFSPDIAPGMEIVLKPSSGKGTKFHVRIQKQGGSK